MNFEDLFVLVIEPSRVQRSIITNHLKSFSIEDIEEFSTAEEALAFMQTQKPDLVVSSMHLPDMTGTDVVAKMREDESLSGVTFMLISSETHHRYLEPIRQSGAIALLPKPFDRDDMEAALQSILLYLSDQTVEEEGVFDDRFEDLNILVVDDSRMSRKYVARILSGIGIHNITEATDGTEGLEKINATRFDMVISDYNMPNLDGREMVERIRQETDQSSVPVVMITSEEDQQRLAAIQKAGVTALCSKPLSYEFAKDIIARLVLEQH
jgi:two-component system chemotaxis response regulator CheY